MKFPKLGFGLYSGDMLVSGRAHLTNHRENVDIYPWGEYPVAVCSRKMFPPYAPLCLTHMYSRYMLGPKVPLPSPGNMWVPSPSLQRSGPFVSPGYLDPNLNAEFFKIHGNTRPIAWMIIPVSKWLITMVSKSPKWGYSPYKWPKWLIKRSY